MRFKVEVVLTLVFGGLALIGLIIPVVGYIFIAVAAFVLADIVMGKRGYELRLAVPIRWKHKDSREEQIVKLNKLELVGEAIMEAKEITPVGKDVPVYITESNKLAYIYPQEIKDILVKLQDDEKVITIKSFPDWMLPSEGRFMTDTQLDKMIEVARDSSIKQFVVTVLNGFDKWYKSKCGK